MSRVYEKEAEVSTISTCIFVVSGTQNEADEKGPVMLIQRVKIQDIFSAVINTIKTKYKSVKALDTNSAVTLQLIFKVGQI